MVEPPRAGGASCRWDRLGPLSRALRPKCTLAAQRAARLPILAPLPDRRWRSSPAKDGTAILRRRRPSSLAGALAVPAPWPAAGPPLAFLQLLLGPADAAFSGYLLPGVLDPADELVSGQRRDVVPSIECRRVGNQRIAQVCGKLVHYPAGHSLAVHGTTVAVQDSDALTRRAARVLVRSAGWAAVMQCAPALARRPLRSASPTSSSNSPR